MTTQNLDDTRLSGKLDAAAMAKELGGAKPSGNGWWSCKCPAHEDNEPSLGLKDAEDGGVAWICHAGCTNRDIANALEQLELIPPKREARRDTARPRPAPQRPPDPAPAFNGLPAALRLYAEAKPIRTGTVAATYLKGRRCALPHPAGDLRQLDRYRHPVEDHIGPALIGLITDAVTAEPMSIHLTWIRPDGSDKAALDRPRWVRKGLPKAGGVVRLWPAEAVTYGLGIAEGIETALTMARGYRPVWACLDQGNMRAFPVLDGIDSLLICADHDAPDEKGRQAGISAARACAARWVTAGREVRPYLPKTEGQDLNDEVRS